MGTYRVDSVLRNREGRELRRMESFGGDAESAKDALAQAFERLRSIVGADGRIDSVVSTVHGPKGERVVSSDYADELGSGASCSGLTEETRPEDFEPATTSARDALESVGIINDGWGIHAPELEKEPTEYQKMIRRLIQVGPPPLPPQLQQGLDEQEAGKALMTMTKLGVSIWDDEDGCKWVIQHESEYLNGEKHYLIEHLDSGKRFTFVLQTMKAKG